MTSRKFPWVFNFYFWPLLSLFLMEYPLELNSSIVLKGLWETKIFKKNDGVKWLELLGHLFHIFSGFILFLRILQWLRKFIFCPILFNCFQKMFQKFLGCVWLPKEYTLIFKIGKIKIQKTIKHLHGVSQHIHHCLSSVFLLQVIFFLFHRCILNCRKIPLNFF